MCQTWEWECHCQCLNPGESLPTVALARQALRGHFTAQALSNPKVNHRLAGALPLVLSGTQANPQAAVQLRAHLSLENR